ncbi:DUF2252 domain-containing protein [Vallicoccus soli]|uniref:DUF2252 domain-containing protein n=2 Tax=Vallicoccus soli TaxID=2339232 RepID=A0A3A3Z0A0_9ACTN|nr:DUF2252 domain-containing protein [Vallicoccus soli]
MAGSPLAFRTKFRKMAADPFAFYRGSACLFYEDVAGLDDPWLDERTSRVWVQGDLHAENFGTYMDGQGVLIFDVNDFDEAYLGPFTWDLRRLAASLGLLGWSKALPDDVIAELVRTYARAYVDQVRWFVESDRDHEWALRLDTARGPLLDVLQRARLSTRDDLLSRTTYVDGHERRFREGAGVRRLDEDERAEVVAAFEAYVGTVPAQQGGVPASVSFAVKDVVGRSGFGIGSAGLPAYNVLVEGRSQALENDVVLSMKQGATSALSRHVEDERVRGYFRHNGHRTAVSQRALQAHADPWLGWTEVRGTGFVVSELSPYVEDLDWGDLADPEQLLPVVEQLGRATAKVHSVSDEDSDQSLVPFQTEDAIAAAVGDRGEDLAEDLVGFGLDYSRRVRRDHGLFVEAFRNDEIAGVTAHG